MRQVLKIKENINVIDIEKLKEKYNRVYIYGTGNYANWCIRYWGEESVKKNVTAFIVSTKENNPESLCGIPVVEVDRIEKRNTLGVVIIAISLNNAVDAIDRSKQLKFDRIITISERMFEDICRKISSQETKAYYESMLRTPKLFKLIAIETLNRCNGTCQFCPVNANEEQRPYHLMSEELFHSIIGQLEKIKYEGQVALYCNNEPFLDKRIAQFAQYAREHLKMHIYFYLLMVHF